MCLNENESTISITIDEITYNSIKNVPEDVVFIFSDKKRLSERLFQKKITKSKTYILSLYNNKMYPLIRTQSIETLTSISSIDVERATLRKIIFKENRFRITFNKEEADYGVHYTCCGEVEYDEETSYTTIIDLEQLLMSYMEKWHHFIKFEHLTLENLFKCSAPKIQNFACADLNQPYYWAYKWNGIKAKMLYNDGMLSLWPDANDIQIQKIDIPLNIDFMCLQVELMTDRIVIVELIATFYNGNIHTVEPKTNRQFLKQLYREIKNHKIIINNLPVMVQRFKKNPLPDKYTVNIHDGFIISQNNLLIKWKIPTIDVKYVQLPNKTYGFVIDKKIVIDGIKILNFTEPLQENAIYEIDCNLDIIRRRIDRKGPSLHDEYLVFNDLRCKLV